MRNAYSTFERNLNSVKTLHAIHAQFIQIYSALDLSEILRAEYVLTVSAFDCYLHDLVQSQMHNITFSSMDNEILPAEYAKFKIPIGALKNILEASEDDKKQILHTALKRSLAEFSFESPQTVERAMSYIGISKIWTKISKIIKSSPDDIKKKLSVIIFRRNCIAHQADIANYIDDSKQNIEREDVDDVIRFIEDIVHAINDISKDKSM